MQSSNAVTPVTILVGVEARSEEEVDRIEELLEDIGAKHVRSE